MPRLNVIILTKAAGDITAVLWADVPVARQSMYANAAAKSAWTGATATDNTNLQNGSVSESLITQRMPSGASAIAIDAQLQAAWQSYQTFITNNNPWSSYGTTWDGATWTIAGLS